MRLVSKERLSQIVLMLCCAALLSAWVAEYVFGFSACILCLYQRYLYIAAIFVLSFGLYFMHGRHPNIFLALTALILLACAGVAGYQVAVEQGWVPLPKLCQTDLPTGTFEEFKAALTQKAYAPCNEVVWSLFGISMAGYNFLLAMFLSIISILGIGCHAEHKKKFTRR